MTIFKVRMPVRKELTQKEGTFGSFGEKEGGKVKIEERSEKYDRKRKRTSNKNLKILLRP